MNMRVVTSPSGARFTVRNDFADKFTGLLGDLEASGYSINGQQSGGYNPRNIAGTNTPSKHASGAAIDINWTDNARGTRGNIDPALARQLAQKHGLVWGGDWKNPDPMHFEIPGQPGHYHGDGHNHGPAPAAPGLSPLSILDPDTGQPKTPAPQPMAAPQPQVQKMAEEPTFLDSLTGKMNSPLFQQGLGLFLASAQGKDMNQGLSAGMDRAQSAQAQQMKADAEKRRLIQENALKTMLSNPQTMQGLPPALAEIARATGDAGPIAQYIMKTSIPERTDDIKEYEYSKARGDKRTFEEFMGQKRQQSGSYSKEHFVIQNPDGTETPAQLSSQGGYKPLDLPKGAKLAPGVKTIDAGDHTIIYNAKTGDVLGRQPKNLAEAERQKEVGTAQGKAQVDLPGVESNAKNIKDYISGVKKEPNLNRVTGYGAYLLNLTPEARTAQSKLNQLTGNAFLMAFQGLKGGGAITETEGAAATKAYTRLQEQVQKNEDFTDALNDFEKEVDRLADLARAKARGVTGPRAPANAPQQAPDKDGWMTMPNGARVREVR